MRTERSENVMDFVVCVVHVSVKHQMERHQAEDLVKAASHLEDAHTSLVEAVKALRFHDRSRVLLEVGKRFSEMAAHFREYRLTAGLRVELVDAKTGARAMGRSRSEKKLAALAIAREAKANKDHHKAEMRESARRRGLRLK